MANFFRIPFVRVELNLHSSPITLRLYSIQKENSLYRYYIIHPFLSRLIKAIVRYMLTKPSRKIAFLCGVLDFNTVLIVSGQFAMFFSETVIHEKRFVYHFQEED